MSRMQSVEQTKRPEFVPWDIEVAHINFGANCGPAAFAAITGSEVCRIMQYFPHFPARPYTNLTQMKAALTAAGYKVVVEKCQAPLLRGLNLIQWCGPWTEKDFFSKWSLIHTHWVAVDRDWVFDVNTKSWQTWHDWASKTVPALLAEVPRSTGWRVKYGVEILGGKTS